MPQPIWNMYTNLPSIKHEKRKFFGKYRIELVPRAKWHLQFLLIISFSFSILIWVQIKVTVSMNERSMKKKMKRGQNERILKNNDINGTTDARTLNARWTVSIGIEWQYALRSRSQFVAHTDTRRLGDTKMWWAHAFGLTQFWFRSLPEATAVKKI